MYFLPNSRIGIAVGIILCGIIMAIYAVYSNKKPKTQVSTTASFNDTVSWHSTYRWENYEHTQNHKDLKDATLLFDKSTEQLNRAHTVILAKIDYLLLSRKVDIPNSEYFKTVDSFNRLIKEITDSSKINLKIAQFLRDRVNEKN